VGRCWRCQFWQSFTILAYPLEKGFEQDSRLPHIGYQTKIQCPSFGLGTAGPGGTKWVWQNSKIINPRNISVISRYPSRDYWSSGSDESVSWSKFYSGNLMRCIWYYASDEINLASRFELTGHDEAGLTSEQ
jgi:hypothetical protein